MWFAISVYVEALLFLIYLTVHSLSAFLSQFRWWDVFGGTTGSNSTNIIEKLGSAFIFYYLIAAIIFGMVKYERDILSGEVKLNLYAKIGVSILVALVVPLLLIMFTNLGYNSVQQ